MDEFMKYRGRLRSSSEREHQTECDEECSRDKNHRLWTCLLLCHIWGWSCRSCRSGCIWSDSRRSGILVCDTLKVRLLISICRGRHISIVVVEWEFYHSDECTWWCITTQKCISCSDILLDKFYCLSASEKIFLFSRCDGRVHPDNLWCIYPHLCRVSRYCWPLRVCRASEIQKCRHNLLILIHNLCSSRSIRPSIEKSCKTLSWTNTLSLKTQCTCIVHKKLLWTTIHWRIQSLILISRRESSRSCKCESTEHEESGGRKSHMTFELRVKNDLYCIKACHLCQKNSCFIESFHYNNLTFYL